MTRLDVRNKGIRSLEGISCFSNLTYLNCIGNALSELPLEPEHYREVVLCVYFRQMSVEQTAGELAISSGTVKSRLSRAREQLKKLLERRLSYEG